MPALSVRYAHGRVSSTSPCCSSGPAATERPRITRVGYESFLARHGLVRAVQADILSTRSDGGSARRPTSLVDSRPKVARLPSFGGSIVPRKRQKRLKVAVDVDEVLGCFLASLNKFYLEEHGREFGVSDYFLYDFAKVWKCSPDASNHTVHAFFKSHHFSNGIQPLPGAFEALQRLQDLVDLVVVTSRQHCIQEPTLEWVHENFPQIFSSIHFGNHYALEGISQRKVDMCRDLQADILIDDNPVYAEECAAAGVRVLLFDWDGSYPWATTPAGPDHDLITRVLDWAHVEREINKLVAVDSTEI